MSGADLSDNNLKSAWLVGADLSRANLSLVEMGGPENPMKDNESTLGNIGGVFDAPEVVFNLVGMNGGKADLSKANLSHADLLSAHLFGAILSNANLKRASLIGADLRRADLTCAKVNDANLSEAELKNAKLSDANLSGACLTGVSGLTIKQLSKVKTLYKAKLDPELMKQVKEKYPLLLENVKEGEGEEINACKQAIKTDPDDASAYYDLGNAHFNSGKQIDLINQPIDEIEAKEAIESYKQAIRLDPDHKSAHSSLGAAYIESGKYEEAIESCKQAISIDPDYADAHYNLACSYSLLGDVNKALESLGRSIDLGFDDIKHIENDSDLNGLRDEAGYKKLINKLKS